MRRKRKRARIEQDPALLTIAAKTYSIRLQAIEGLFHALELGPRQTSLRQVLRWFMDNTVYNPETRRDECIYHAADVARSIWVDCGLASIRASVAYWRALRIVRTEKRSTPGGGKLPPRAWIDWRAVVSRCGGRVSDRGAVRGGPTVATEAAGRPGAIPAGLPTLEDVPAGSVPTALDPVAADCTPAAETHNATSGGPSPSSPQIDPACATAASAHSTNGGPSPSFAQTGENQDATNGGPSPSSFSLHGGLVSMEVILAAARAVCSDTDTVSVTDPDDVDDRIRISNRISCRNVLARRSAAWSDVRRLAAQAAGVVHNGRAPTDQGLRKIYLAAAAAALTLFRTRTPGQWLLGAARCVADRRQSRSQERVHDPVRYLMGVLRSQCGLLAIKLSDDQAACKNWFAAVMRPFEIAVELQCVTIPAARPTTARPGMTEPVAKAAGATAPSAAEWQRVAIELGLAPDASTREIDDAYQRRAASMHCPAPQHGGNGQAEKTSKKQGSAAEKGPARDTPNAAENDCAALCRAAERGVAIGTRPPPKPRRSEAELQRAKEAQLAALARAGSATARPP